MSQFGNQDISLLVEQIIVNAISLYSRENDLLEDSSYNDENLARYIIDPLEALIFAPPFAKEFEIYHSAQGNLPMCTKFFKAQDMHYTCEECQSDSTCVMCEECFLNSKHTKHLYSCRRSLFEGGCCDCGDEESWKKDPYCSSHDVNSTSKFPFNPQFMQRLREIFEFLSVYISSVGDPDMNPIPLSQNHPPNYFNPPSTHVLLVFNDELHTYGDVIPCLEACLEIPSQFAENLAHSINDRGFAICKSGLSSDELSSIYYKIQIFPLTDYTQMPLRTKIVDSERVYHMRIASILMRFLNKFCCKKTQFCDLIAEVIFDKTDFMDRYVFNEPLLWKEFRHDVIYMIVYPVLYSDPGKIYLTNFYLRNLELLYTNYVTDDHNKTYCLINLTVQFITSPSLVVHLIEHGFLCKIIDCLSDIMIETGLHRLGKPSEIYRDGKLSTMRMERIGCISDVINECLCVKYEPSRWSTNFREELKKAGDRLANFALDFDDMEPIQKVYVDVENSIEYEPVLVFILGLHSIFVNFVRWILYDNEVTHHVLQTLFNLIKSEFLLTYNLTPRENGILFDELCTGPNVLYDSCSFFNLSRRLFIDIFMDSLSKQKLTPGFKESVVGDSYMLIWISRPSITALSIASNYIQDPWNRNSINLESMVKFYHHSKFHHYLFMQDFNMIQILMIYLEPKKLIQYLLWNLCPKLRELYHTTFEMYENHVFSISGQLRDLLYLFYNGMTEWHFIGVHPDPEYYFLERQIIHFLAARDMSRKSIAKLIFGYRDVYPMDETIMSKNLDTALKKVSYTKSFIHLDKRHALSQEYFKQVNRFHFLYNGDLLSKAYEEITNLFRMNRYSFAIPEIGELKPEFVGILKLIFSNELFKLILSVFVKYGSIEHKNSVQSDDFELSLMILCFILKLSKINEIRATYKSVIENILAPKSVLGDRTISDFLLDEQPKIQEPTIISVINYFLNLMKGEGTVAKNVVDPAKERAKAYKDEILKQMQNSQKRFIETNQEWLQFSEIVEENQVLTTEEKLTNSDFLSLHCENCQKERKLDHLINPNMYDWPTNFISLSFVKKTRRLRKDPFVEPLQNPDEIENECMVNREYLFSYARASSMNSDLIITGCRHFYHEQCTSSRIWGDAAIFHDHSSTYYCVCQICQRKQNFMIPVIPPFFKNKLPSKSFLDSILEYQIFMQKIERNQISNFTELRKYLKVHNDDIFRLYTYNLSTDEYDIFLLAYKVFTNILPMKADDMIDSAYLMDCIIERTISCLSMSIRNIDIINANNCAIFGSDMIDNTNFKTLVLFSRFCYFSSGLAPFLYSLISSRPFCLNILNFLYLKQSQDLGRLYKIISQNLSEIEPPDFYFFCRVDHFDNFIHSFISSSNLINLNLSTEEKIPNFEVNVVKVYLLSIILKSMLVFHINPNYTPVSHSFSDNEINEFYDLFIKVSDSPFNHNNEAKKYLYHLFYKTALPFLRRVSILFYQIFDWSPNEVLKCIYIFNSKFK